MASTLLSRGGCSVCIAKFGIALTCVAALARALVTSNAQAGLVESVSIEAPAPGNEHVPPGLIRINTPTFKAGPGEMNTLTLTRSGKNKYLVRDLTSPLVAGPGCTTVDANTASCDILNTSNVVADTSDQDDTITIEGKDTSASIDAGSGSDVITDRDGTSTLTGGGGGHDQINAGGGDDTLSDTAVASGDADTVHLTPSDLPEILGPAKFSSDQASRKPEVGARLSPCSCCRGRTSCCRSRCSCARTTRRRS